VTREATRSLHQRLRGIERLLTEVASPGQPVVVVGDFNRTPQSKKSEQTRRRLLHLGTGSFRVPPISVPFMKVSKTYGVSPGL
jgi:endonuclease/exonuclease/phosphatase family metal-dependent hydrolase